MFHSRYAIISGVYCSKSRFEEILLVMVPSDNSGKGAGSDKEAVKLNGAPCVLVIDDEELIREVASMMVEEEGGKVLVASNGKQAIDIFQQHKDSIDCVFSDFSMPAMNGYEVYLELDKLKSGVPFVLVSGLKSVAEVEELRRTGRIEFLSKPFHQVELVKAINRARDSRSAAK